MVRRPRSLYPPLDDRDIVRADQQGCLPVVQRGAGGNMKTMGGIDLLQDTDQEAAKNLFARLAEYGLFVVRHGELESWLKGLGANGHGPNWLISIFEKMGEDPDSSTYVSPGDNDVWAFTGEIKTWLTNSSRKGIPS